MRAADEKDLRDLRDRREEVDCVDGVDGVDEKGGLERMGEFWGSGVHLR